MTIYEALRTKLGREPTNAELKADVALQRGTVRTRAKATRLGKAWSRWHKTQAAGLVAAKFTEIAEASA